VARSQAAYEVDDLNKARGYALAAIGMDYASEKAKNQREKAQGLLKAIEIRTKELEEEREKERLRKQEEALRSEVAQAEAALKLEDTKTASEHVLTAIGMPGESDAGMSLKAKAQALLETIKKLDKELEERLKIEEQKRLAEAIRTKLNLAIATKEGGLLDRALILAITASKMAGDSTDAVNLKAEAEAEAENIKVLIAKAHAAEEQETLYHRILELVKIVAAVIMSIVGVVAMLILVKMWIGTRVNVR
jgi:hypothetical protein